MKSAAMKEKRPQKELDRFWSKVKKGPGCWEWQAANSRGYGIFSNTAGCGKGAHRYSWTIHNGPIPPGAYILHKCDNPSCVRPDHLELGDHLQNMRDAEDRMRMAYGTRHGLSKLNPDKVKLIVELRKHGARIEEIGACFDVGHNAIRAIFEGITWSHVTGFPKRKYKELHGKS